MAGAGWIYAMDEAALPEGGMASAYPRRVHILLTRVGGDVYAVSGKCAHMACPLVAGFLEGPTLTCPCHDWRFDVRSGQFLDEPELSSWTDKRS